jgi:hypothetical protein
MQVEIDVKKAQDTGMAIVLVLLLIELFTRSSVVLNFAIAILLINMIIPKLFIPLAYIWFGMAQIIGRLTSAIMLFLIYTFIVLPVGLFRKALGKDELQIGKWKQSNESVFKTRNYIYCATDLEKPY